MTEPLNVSGEPELATAALAGRLLLPVSPRANLILTVACFAFAVLAVVAAVLTLVLDGDPVPPEVPQVPVQYQDVQVT